MKILMTVFVLTFALISVQAQQQTATPAPAVKQTTAPAAQRTPVDSPADWDFFGFVLFPGVPSNAEWSRVYGIKLSPTVSAGYGIVGGLELAAAACMTENVDGVQLAPLFNSAKDIDGFQASIANVAEKMTGIQLGIVNVSEKSGIQIGVVNYIKDSPVPFMPIINFYY